MNADGSIDDADYLQWPGQPYEDAPPETWLAYEKPMVSEDIYQDQWGTIISGYAPIVNEAGEAVAVLAIDLSVEDIAEMTRASFRPFWYFCILLVLFLFIRLAAFNTLLFSEILQFWFGKKPRRTFILFACLALIIAIGIQQSISFVQTMRLRERATAIAATSALQFSSEELEELHVLKDVRKPVYMSLVERLLSIQEKNTDIAFVYILRPTQEEDVFEFVVASDGVNPFRPSDVNLSSSFDDMDEIGYPGIMYDVSNMDALVSGRYTKGVTANKKPYTDQWGTFITAYAPIYDSNKNVAGVLSVDISAEKVLSTSRDILFLTYVFFIAFGILVLLRVCIEYYQVISKCVCTRKFLVHMSFCIVCSVGITMLIRSYMLNVVRNQIGERLISIVATAAPEIDPNDLEDLHFARDMKTEEYQRVFKKLNSIRDANKDIMYVYIFRSTNQKNMLQFVADADSNFNIVAEENGDIEVLAPGMFYDKSLVKYVFEFDKIEYSDEFVIDKWGQYLSASAPIKNPRTSSEFLLGVDMDVEDLLEEFNNQFNKQTYFVSIFLLLFIGIFFIKKH